MDALPGRSTTGFGEMLRKLRLDRGLTQEDLADRAGLSVRAVGDLERGRAVPRRNTVGRLCAALELDEESQRRFTALARTGWAERQRAEASPRISGHAVPAPRSPLVIPAQLPWDVPGLVGRDGEVEQILDAAAGTAGGIWVFDGLGGVGKTALAVHIGHLLANRCPDGQLFIDLRGFGLHQPSVSPSVALGQLLRALSGDERRLPTAVAELAAMFRSTLAGRRVLIVLDNAASAEQVRALLPGAPGCFVLVTSRCRLSGLAARDGARRITLRGLDPDSAIALLTGIAGPELTRRQPTAPGDLASLCGFLPLALRIAAERAKAELGSLTSLITDLADERSRLDLLKTDDESTSVRAVFSWSYRALEPDAANLFRLLGLLPGPDFTIHAAAALADTDEPNARQMLGRLAVAHLIEQSGPARYHFHDLMRVYAAERAMADETSATRDVAVSRVLRWYLATAVAADRLISPQRYRPGLDQTATEHALPPLRSYREAVAWCDAELDNFVAIVLLASTAGKHALAWRLAWALAGYLDLRRPWHAWLATHRTGLESARRAHEPLGEATILTGLALAHYYPRLFAEAEDHCRRAHRLWRDLGDRHGEAIIINAVANIRLETRDLDAAVALYLEALEASSAAGGRRGEGVVLSNLATAYCELGQFNEVLEYAPAAMQAARDTRNQRAEALSLCQMARALAAVKGFAEADEHFRRAVGLAREADDRHVEAWTLDYLGTALVQAGRPEDAALTWQHAATLFDGLDDPQATDLRCRLSSLTASSS